MRKSRGKREVIDAVQRAERALFAAQEALTDETADLLGLNKTDHRCLDIIQRYGRMTAGQLADAAHLSTGATTTAIDRLERAGFVQRVADPADRRRVLVEMSSAGMQRGWFVFEPIVASSRAFLDRFSEDELCLILDFLTQSAAHWLDQAEATRRRAGLPAQPSSDDA
jgi:DNA-binding MarR family transcriptional regulator